MTCAEAKNLILEADLSELKGSGESGLSQHLRGCARCRNLAQTVLEEEAVLGEELSASVPTPNLDDLLDRASSSPSRTPPWTKTRLRRAGLGLVPLAAAATMAGLLLLGNPGMPGDPYSPSEPAPGLGLEIPEGQNVAVLATNNPNITVLWFF